MKSLQRIQGRQVISRDETMPVKRGAFSLVELLCVMAVISVLMVITVFYAKGPGDAQKLRTAGDMVSGMSMHARQYALSHSTLTAIVILGKSAPATRALRSVAVFALEATPSGAEWKQIVAWRQFQEGVIIDPDESSFFVALARQPSPPLPSSLQVGGEPVTDYKYQVFLPNGRILNENSVTLKVLPGFMTGGSLASTQKNNFLTLTLIGTTGQTKVFQP